MVSERILAALTSPDPDNFLNRVTNMYRHRYDLFWQPVQ
jgi:hypothetical protein